MWIKQKSLFFYKVDDMHSGADSLMSSRYICDSLQENRAQRGVREYREKIDRFLKNVLFQACVRERLGLL